jgi:hypothetical protein
MRLQRLREILKIKKACQDSRSVRRGFEPGPSEYKAQLPSTEDYAAEQFDSPTLTSLHRRLNESRGYGLHVGRTEGFISFREEVFLSSPKRRYRLCSPLTHLTEYREMSARR